MIFVEVALYLLVFGASPAVLAIVFDTKLNDVTAIAPEEVYCDEHMFV